MDFSPHRFCIAPMLGWTDRHCRFFLRLLSRHARLYTEMVHTAALLRGDPRRHLTYDPAEHPIALQLGGNDPAALAAAARIAADFGYDEVNLNVGCPSDRVHAGHFGACLMAEPERVAECVAAMCAAVALPVTVKTRIGIDERDGYDELLYFVQHVTEAGCYTWIVHARKAWLRGLSPRENRTLPPLRHEVVYQLKRDVPHVTVVLNGGLLTVEQCAVALERVDGVMMGRAAYENPYGLAEVDQRLFGANTPPPTRHEVIAALLPYLEVQLRLGTPLHDMTRHLMGLFHGIPGARAWRRQLSEAGSRRNAGLDLVERALQQIQTLA